MQTAANPTESQRILPNRNESQISLAQLAHGLRESFGLRGACARTMRIARGLREDSGTCIWLARGSVCARKQARQAKQAQQAKPAMPAMQACLYCESVQISANLVANRYKSLRISANLRCKQSKRSRQSKQCKQGQQNKCVWGQHGSVSTPMQTG